MNQKDVFSSILLFFIAGLCEIGGGYLVWLWLRDNLAWWVGVIGGFVLFLYGVVPTLQKSHFHRIYAAYGGVFIVMSVMWGWLIDGTQPDNYDVIGAIIAIIGVLIIYYYPRKGGKVWSKS
ncbi:YnfA family protein [Candidatus Nitrosotenuis aquarius]|uniref:YnfA family protein n=1 Tax=Candidatus Nitrosotenuis aquarius TaxID=1846278 RepID=UPI000C1F0257|nr:YnfA family protein [Candidatus Nitrosotenuis aquarius]